MKITPIRLRALKALRKRGPITAANIGWELWGHTLEIFDGGSHSQNRFCRAAGAVLQSLRREGLARVGCSNGVTFEWIITGK